MIQTVSQCIKPSLLYCIVHAGTADFQDGRNLHRMGFFLKMQVLSKIPLDIIQTPYNRSCSSLKISSLLSKFYSSNHTK